MAGGKLDKVMNHIRRLVGACPAGATDRQLLERFAEQGDEEAFERILQRHGPMVLGVCRRIVKDPHLANDVFQAVFVVLVRKAGSVLWEKSVAGWLYKVTQRIAVKAKAKADRRQAQETELKDMPAVEATNDLANSDLRLVLDEELSQLPAKYRLPLVLCYLEGRSYTEAAEELNWPAGTVSGRLARGRDLLRERLVRRGLTLSAGALATALTPNVLSAPVPVSLLTSTLKAATAIAAGKTTAGIISAYAIVLAEGALKTMLVTKMKIAAAALLVLTIGAYGGGIAYQALAEKQAVVESDKALPVASSKKNDPKAAQDGDKFNERLLEIARTYQAFGRVDGELFRWAPTMCFVPQVKQASARLSDSKDGDTHGRKLYSLFASQKTTYLELKGDSNPTGFAIIKESWIPEEIPDDGKKLRPQRQEVKKHADGSSDYEHYLPYARKNGKLYHASKQADLFIMFKLDPKTPGTDKGWVYGTVTADAKTVTSAGKVASCMKCHQEAPHDRLFGLAKVEEEPKGKTDPPGVPLEAKLVAKKDTYTLDLGGKTEEEFRKLLQNKEGKFPPAPKVDLAIELKNTGDKEVKILTDSYRVKLELNGPGAETGRHVPIAANRPSATAVVTLAPGKSHSVPISELSYVGTDGSKTHHYWTKPGEYTLTIQYSTAISPPGAKHPTTYSLDAKGSVVNGNDYGSVIVKSSEINLKVENPKPD